MRLNIHVPCLVCHTFPAVFGAVAACLPFFPSLKKMGRLRSSVSALIARQACSSHCFEPVTFSNLTRTQAIYFAMRPASPARAFHTAVFVFCGPACYFFVYIFFLPFGIWSRSPRSESSSVGAFSLPAKTTAPAAAAFTAHLCCCRRCGSCPFTSSATSS